MSNPYLDRVTGTKHGRRAEKKASKRLGGSLTPASGALDYAKGDIKKSHFLIDSKATNKDSFRVTKEQLQKISREALDAGKTPALLVQFVDDLGGLTGGGSWVVLPERVFKELAE